MNKYEQFENVTFHPACKPDRFKLGQDIKADDLTDELEDDYIIIWHGVRVHDKVMASRIINKESTGRVDIKVNPKHLGWVDQQINKKETWWVRFKKWLLTLFPFLR